MTSRQLLAGVSNTMKIFISETSEELGQAAAKLIAEKIKAAIAEKGSCRIVLSTGASQFNTLSALGKAEGIDWDKVTMFHLDEYVGLPITHGASFRKYLKERFIEIVHPGAYYFVNGEGDVENNIRELTEKLREAPIDVGVIGIGENGHIAFNDPPADFNTKEAYIVVNLDQACKRQQMGEGWFATIEDVPNQAISMTPYQIMQCRCIVSAVPDERKAKAVADTLGAKKATNHVPASLLKTHQDCSLFLDRGSASLCTTEMLQSV